MADSNLERLRLSMGCALREYSFPLFPILFALLLSSLADFSGMCNRTPSFDLFVDEVGDLIELERKGLLVQL